MLRVEDVFLIGDYNDDGAVDAADYTLWRHNLGAPAGTLPNDIHNTPIGALQYDTWRAHFGNTFPKPGASLASRVPEPATLALVSIAMLFLRRSKSVGLDWQTKEHFGSFSGGSLERADHSSPKYRDAKLA